jgi:D,D-heptose 1,7-bisphosphate phosphatase
MHVRQAVILVGGKGTRLGQLTQNVPKPLLEIGPGVRFLDPLLLDFARHGFTDIILLAGHLGDQVEAAYQGEQLLQSRIRVIREPEPQGTGGALRFAADHLDPWFVMANGDSLFEFNLRELTRSLTSDFTARLALREVPDPARYGTVKLQGDRVTGFLEKSAETRGPALINGGIYALSREIMKKIAGPCSIEQDVFPVLAAKGRLQGKPFSGYFLDIGLPDTYEQARREIPQRMRRPCAFLDRDGVLNEDRGYTHKSSDLVWIKGAREAVKLLNDSGYLVVVVTNQAGVARGFYSEEDVRNFHQHMDGELAEFGAHVDAWYYCPYHPEASDERYRHTSHPDRKPNPGMLLRAMQHLRIDRSRSFLIGDRTSDIEAAVAANLAFSHLYEGGDMTAIVTKLMGARARQQGG